METRRKTKNEDVQDCSLSLDGLQGELEVLKSIISGQKKPGTLDFKLLERLTGDFSDGRRIGKGGFGEVYKGILPNGMAIAVKRLNKDIQTVTDEKTFIREIDSIIKVDHPNIVRLLGYCYEIKKEGVQVDGKTVMAENPERLLCYQYISKGSLENYVTDELRGFGWDTRFQIIKGICDGLLYLHHHKKVLHMDLKPANILLGDQMVPKITDFGLSRHDVKTQITSAPRKYSQGYCAPEYIDSGERSSKSDIYSLGVTMLELVTGSRKEPNTTKVLRRWRHRWNKSSKHAPLGYLQVKKCLELAVSCQERDRINRPFMKDIVLELNKLDSFDGQIIESSLEKIISSSDDMLRIEPLELHFTLAHDKKQISCSIKLTNDTDYYMAFRIATTSLLSFSIQPTLGIAEPRDSCTTTITLPTQEIAWLKNHREGFIVHSTRVERSLKAVDIVVDMFKEEGNKVVDEVNLTVYQKDLANLSAEMGSLGTSSQEVRQSVKLSPHHDYEDPRHMEVLESLFDGSKSPTHLPISLLRYITTDFSDERRIGTGQFADLYKGIHGNKIVAIKRLCNRRTIEDRMFLLEVEVMMSLEHKNIVRFLGYCLHTEEKVVQFQGRVIMAEERERLLCFEYFTNGNLEKYITDELGGLEWHTRYQILLGICEGLQYLHKKKVIHMDLKPSCILLSDYMVPKITNFSLSRLEEGKSRIMTTGGVMKLGYFAPEYIYEGRMSAKADIYSLGVVITELVTGRKKSPNINSVLRRWLHRWNKYANIMDALLWRQQVTKCLELALRCLHLDPSQRPHVWDIIHELESGQTNFCLDGMLGVEPLELHFPIELSTQQSRLIHLTNDTNHHIAFMIGTMSELGYNMQPDKGVVPPRSTYSVTITLQTQEREPGTQITHWKQEFTVRSTRVDMGVTAADISDDMFDEEEGKVVDEVNVMVIYGTQ